MKNETEIKVKLNKKEKTEEESINPVENTDKEWLFNAFLLNLTNIEDNLIDDASRPRISFHYTDKCSFPLIVFRCLDVRMSLVVLRMFLISLLKKEFANFFSL